MAFSFISFPQFRQNIIFLLCSQTLAEVPKGRFWAFSQANRPPDRTLAEKQRGIQENEA
jgi:hypothetical protein